jgi:hypothetical protein
LIRPDGFPGKHDNIIIPPAKDDHFLPLRGIIVIVAGGGRREREGRGKADERQKEGTEAKRRLQPFGDVSCSVSTKSKL